MFGSRSWKDRELVHQTLGNYLGDHPAYLWCFVHGGHPRGVDAFTHEYARQKGLPIMTYRADRKATEAQRNKVMINSRCPHVAFAFQSANDTFGTNQCLRILGGCRRKAGSNLSSVFVVHPNGSMKLY